ncbi:hypothetical protein HYPSUDRAFT_164549 [Hypholoma sublateritium FD-334 SS-4]|uniref:Uncharacterized protein n=1 Tax=Hypholoma sublateritium (strain FD-334 SS-4) TaxID=945553 RepID=A0A0D2P0X5_HYPSF|nr:hypothetical protein HYPSUDRAFT_164549 [Hypholoma sublateritium FD-334 SS-4]
MVREFASSVEQLKEMQALYHALVAQVHALFDAHIEQHARAAAPPVALPRTTTTTPSPSFFAQLSTKARPKTRARSNTNPSPGQNSTSASASASAGAAASAAATASMTDVSTAQLAYKELAALFYTINAKYRISWECAELLVELGGGAPAPSATSPPAVISPPPSSASAPFMGLALGAAFDGKKRSRERAITLAGAPAPYGGASTSASASASAALIGSAGLPVAPLDPPGPPPASPPSMGWRASTGRHELSQRQLGLLREMLGSAPPPPPMEGEASGGWAGGGEEALRVDREWRWGDARNSTITLPAEPEEGMAHRRTSAEGARRAGRLGMAGIRDMLRALKRGAAPAPGAHDTAGGGQGRRAAQSTTSLSTQSSTASRRHRYPHPRVPPARRPARTSSGPETVRASRELAVPPPTTTDTPRGTFVKPKASPRRPSLASIFRIGAKHRAPSASAADRVPSASSAAAPDQVQRAESSSGGGGAGEDASSCASEEDWDRMDSASDLDAAARARAVATVRGGRSPYLAQQDALPVPAPASAHGAGYALRHALIPRRSFNASASSLRAAEPIPPAASPLSAALGPRGMRLSNVEERVDEPHSPTPKAGSVRSVPQFAASASAPALRDAKLAMTPENIKPLLENAKEVLAKLAECIGEIQALVGSHGVAA